MTEHYFGACPTCGGCDGYLNVGRSHWFYCEKHKVKWCVGSNLFDSWKDQTEEEQRRLYDEVDLGSFTKLGLNQVTKHKRGGELSNVYAHWAEDPAFLDVIFDLYAKEHGEEYEQPAQVDEFIEQLIERLWAMRPGLHDELKRQVLG